MRARWHVIFYDDKGVMDYIFCNSFADACAQAKNLMEYEFLADLPHITKRCS